MVKSVKSLTIYIGALFGLLTIAACSGGGGEALTNSQAPSSVVAPAPEKSEEIALSEADQKKVADVQKKLALANEGSEAEGDDGASPAAVQAKAAKTLIAKHGLFKYESLTVVLAVKNAQKTAAIVKAAGGEIVYDPNLGRGHVIPFLIVNLPPEKVVDKNFVAALDVKAMSIDHASMNEITLQNAGEETAIEEGAPVSFDNIYVPNADVNLPAFRNRQPGQGLGEGTIVAVIDSGVDAAHPIFQDRVVYWDDSTEQSKFDVQPITAEGGKFQFAGINHKFAVPQALEGSKLYGAIVHEKFFGGQDSDQAKSTGTFGVDFNRNSSKDDLYVFVVGQNTATKEWMAIVDLNGDGAFDESEQAKAVMDFNKARALQRQGKNVPHEAMLKFSESPRLVAYPLLFHKDEAGGLKSLSFGMTAGSHGSHVAGIAAGGGKNIVGAAPKAEIMSLRVCVRSCSTPAILRALVKAFYNESGLVPDVVNISLGSSQQYHEDVFDILMRDLAAKFGATFFISASNSGPGYRSLNQIGAFGPVIQVAAHVSKATLKDHYTLAEGIDMPEQNLLYFTSLGPTWTGQLRPNISAPGSAVSASPLIENHTQMSNGTSMSSPLAAGTAAALLSMAKKNPAVAEVYEKRQRKIDGIQGRADYIGGSLTGLPMALRASLEETAFRMPQYTLVHQGHGLIDVNAAYDKFVDLAAQWGREEVDLFEVTLNGDQVNKEIEKKLYDRSTQVGEVKIINFGLKDDGERTNEEILRIKNKGLKLKLVDVQVQNGAGVVKTLTDDLPFSLVINGQFNSKGREMKLVLANALRNVAYSQRHLDKMEAGNTYIAHYGVFDGAQRVFSFTDVVHKPYELTAVKKKHKVPGIDHNPISELAAFSIKDQPIKAGAMHRFPIAVNEGDSMLRVKVGISPRFTGRLLVHVFDPNGHQAVRRGGLAGITGWEHQPKVEFDIPTNGKAGIWEITVAAASGRWLADSQYDMFVESVQFKPSVSSVLVASQKAGSPLMSAFKTIQFANTQKKVTDIKLSVSPALRMDYVSGIPVVPQRWTFQKLDVPASATGGTTTMALQMAGGQAGFYGRVDHMLYKMNAAGQLEPAVQGQLDPRTGLKIFPSVPQPKVGEDGDALYFAVETIGVVPEIGGVNEAATGANVLVYYPDMTLPAEAMPMAVLSPDSTPENPLIMVLGPKDIPGVQKSGLMPRPVLRSTLAVKTDRSDISFNIPIIVFH